MSAHVQARLTPEQYLELDDSMDTRNEYYNGRMYAMAGGTYDHGQIITNIVSELSPLLRKRSCRVVANDLRVRVAVDGLYTYPDVVVVCGEPEFAHGRRETLINPILLVEVLSASTEAYDRGFKAAQYRKLATVEEYVIVSQEEPRVEVIRRAEGGEWRLAEYFGLDAVCHLESVACDVALSNVFDGVVFPERQIESAHPSAGG